MAPLYLRSILDDLIPNVESGSDLPSEIKCYNIPYGLLGFISHLLVYWTLACIWTQRRPLLFFLPASKSTGWDIAIATIALIGSASLTVYTLKQCHNTWQLTVIGVWKLFTTIANGAAAIDAARAAKYDKASRGMPWCISFYCLGMLPGMVGLCSLVKHYWHSSFSLRLLTAFFVMCVATGIVTGLMVACHWGCVCCCMTKALAIPSGAGLLVSIACFVLGAALYSDWALGIMASNLIGIPSSDSSGLYYSYLAVERLPMLWL